MIAIDTNVLVRLFVNDDAGQANKARAFFEEARLLGCDALRSFDRKMKGLPGVALL